MTWNYRVIKQEHPEGTTYAIYEVYYDEQDNILFISKDPMNPHGETITELQNDLKHMRQALKKPILDMDEVLEWLERSGAADYDKWFREQVREAIKEADKPGAVWIPHEEVVKDMQRQREKWAKQAKLPGKSR